MLSARTRLLALAALAALTLAACGSDSGSSSGSASSGSADGKTVWYADVTDANPLVAAIAQSLNHSLTGAGASMTRSFAMNNTTGQIDLGVQAEAFTRAISSQPAAIVYFVLDPKSPKPQIERARRAGIPVFAAFGKPDGIEVNGYITLDDSKQGYLSAQYLAKQLPKGAKVAIIGGPPTPNVNAELEGANKALQEAGVQIVGSVDQQRNLQDNAAGGQQVMQGILQRYPDVQGVFSYNDDSALGAIAATKAAGKKVLFTSRNGSADAIAAIKSGDLLATCDIDPVTLGQNLGKAVVAQVSGSKTYDHSAKLPSPDASQCLITKENVDSWKPYEQRIGYQKIKTG
jgi:ribose transport system substrate-binding protein